MYAWGAHEQDQAGNLTLKSKQTLDALKFVKALYEETMTAEVFTWDASSNNRVVSASFLVLNAISTTHGGETRRCPARSS
jgi:multiple sugar transport system substrate-binding protein